MAVYVCIDLPGVTEQQYVDAFRLVPDLEGEDGQEAGHLVHVGGPSEDGWRIVDVWETEEAFRAFVRDADLAGCWRQVGVELPELVCFPVRHLER